VDNFDKNDIKDDININSNENSVDIKEIIPR